MKLTDEVRAFWEQETCGTHPQATEGDSKHSPEWFKKKESWEDAAKNAVEIASKPLTT